MSNVTATSRDAYHAHVVAGQATTQREQVLTVIQKHGPLTRRQISRLTGNCQRLRPHRQRSRPRDP